jgi:hypothetical protein
MMGDKAVLARGVKLVIGVSRVKGMLARGVRKGLQSDASPSSDSRLSLYWRKTRFNHNFYCELQCLESGSYFQNRPDPSPDPIR